MVAVQHPAPEVPSPRWLFGPAADLLLGCGLGYSIFLGILGGVSGLQSSLAPILSFLILASLVPHYGATMLRVYADPSSRRKYAFFAIHFAFLTALMAVLGAHNVLLNSILLTAHLNWGTWHYAGQNYGIAVMFLRRRGVAVDGPTRSWLRASFVACTLVALVPMNSGAGLISAATNSPLIHFIPLGIPAAVGRPLFAAALVAYGLTLLVAVVRLLRTGSVKALAPALLLIAVQGVWFALPAVLARGTYAGQLQFDDSLLAFVWIAIAHAAQYLWVNAYYASRQTPPVSPARFYASALLAGALLWVLPPIILSPDLLGNVAHDTGLALLVSSVINLNHFVLDGAIWKLRDGHLAKVLLQHGLDDAPASQPRWLKPVFLATGAVALVAYVGAISEEARAMRAAENGDATALEAALQHLRWLGKDGSRLHLSLGQLRRGSGDLAGAEASMTRALQLFENPAALIELGMIAESRGDLAIARERYARAREIDPQGPVAWARGGLVALRSGDRKQAESLLQHALQLDPENPALAKLFRDVGGAGVSASGTSNP